MTRAELAEMIGLAERLIAADEPAVLATLFAASGSTYRRLGSMMVSGPGSMLAGGVSGGCVEEYIARHGRSLVQQQAAAMLSFDADPDGNAGDKPVLGCGGSIEVLVERCGPKHLAFLQEYAIALHHDESSTAGCVVDIADEDASIKVSRSGPTSPGISGRLAGSPSDHPLSARGVRVAPLVSPAQPINRQLERLRRRAIAMAQSQHGVLAGHRRALIHYIPPMTRLVIFGAGDDVRPLAALARSLGWHVTVADRRARLATRARFSDVDAVVTGPWDTAIQQITFTPQTAVVIMTHSLADDIEILPLLADMPMIYFGSLGPEHRRRWVIDGVEKTAALRPEFVATFRGPIGLNLGDRTAAGIAVSITAEILAELNGRMPTPLSNISGLPADDREVGEMAGHVS